MADRIVLARALDANGEIAPGAKATFFESGTSTPLTVYSDAAGTTPVASPLLADAAGQFAATFAAQQVKVVVTDASDVELPGYPSDPHYLVPATAQTATGTTFTPITGNAATTVQAAIAYLTGLWNAVTAFAITLMSSADAAAARSTLGLGTSAINDTYSNTDFTGSNPLELANRSGIAAYVSENLPRLRALAFDEKANGTASQTSSTSWATHDLNTIEYDPDSMLSITSNEFTVTKDGWVRATVLHQGNQGNVRIYNVTDTTEVGLGIGSLSSFKSQDTVVAPVVTGKTYAVQYINSTASAVAAFSLTGVPERYLALEYHA